MHSFFTILLLVLCTTPLSAQPIRMSIEAFGVDVQIEVRDLPEAQAKEAIEAALVEIHDLDKLMASTSSVPHSVGALNHAAGRESIHLDQRVAAALLRSLQYCGWSNGAYGPLGGALYDLWSGGEGLLPDALQLREALLGAQCSQLRLTTLEKGASMVSAALGEGTRVDLRGAARGFAVDRALGILMEHGVSNAWIEIAPVYRALGPGPEGNGWYFALPPAPGDKEPLEEVWLRDQALALVEKENAGSTKTPAVIDQRTGVPSVGVITVVTVAAQALDAEILSHTLFVTGLSEGQRHLGSLQPRPSVLWLLGDRVGSTRPLESVYRWSEVARVKRAR